MKIIKLVLSICLSVTFLASCHNTDKKAASDQEEAKAAIEMAQKNISKKQTVAVKPEENLSGEVQFLTEEQFVAMITEIDNPKGFQYKGNTPCIVDFYADWCRPCVAMHPIFNELAKQYKGKIIIYKVNVDKATSVTEAFGIESIPTIIFFKPNAMPTVMVGAQPKAELVKAVESALLKK